MIDFRTTSRHDAGPLINAATVDHFSRVLRRNDPFGSQQRVSGALADLTAGGSPDPDQLRALLALDMRTTKLSNALLQNYAAERVRGRSLERRSWQAAFELSRSFAGAYDFILRHIRDASRSRAWREHAPIALLGLFHHRQIEFLLRPFVNAWAVPDCWTEVHGAYKYAQAQSSLHRPRIVRRIHEERGAETTIEREYIHVLLLELIGGGQFSPYEAFRVNRLIPRWCAALSLKSDDRQGMVDHGPVHFIVDTDRSEGLIRLPQPMSTSHLYLDPFPMLAMINGEIAGLREVNAVGGLSPRQCDRQLKVLRKVARVFTPKPVRIRRRGERTPAVSTAQAIVGLSQITGMLRHEHRRRSVAAPTAMPHVEEITITVDGGYTGYSSSTAGRRDGPRLAARNGEFGVPHQVWHLQDRSDSGCRFRASIVDASGLFPGALVAIREGPDLPWTLVIVRLLRPCVGEGVDIGVEFVGRNPCGVVLTIDERYAEESKEPPDSNRGHFAGLYLPESHKHPAMPFKTIILAPRDFRAGRCLSLQSLDAARTIRLKEPIEEQDDFIWLPYEVLDRRARDQATQSTQRQSLLPVPLRI